MYLSASVPLAVHAEASALGSDDSARHVALDSASASLSTKAVPLSPLDRPPVDIVLLSRQAFEADVLGDVPGAATLIAVSNQQQLTRLTFDYADGNTYCVYKHTCEA